MQMKLPRSLEFQMLRYVTADVQNSLCGIAESDFEDDSNAQIVRGQSRIQTARSRPPPACCWPWGWKRSRTSEYQIAFTRGVPKMGLELERAQYFSKAEALHQSLVHHQHLTQPMLAPQDHHVARHQTTRH